MVKKVRLVDIADRLGLTKVSVSKALRDHSDISEDTRALVKKTAAEMGYTPNLVARSLSSNRSHTLGVVVPAFAIGLGLALLLNRAFPGRRIIRPLVLLPWAVPGVVVAAAFSWMLDSSYGVVNYLKRSEGIDVYDWNTKFNPLLIAD